MSKAILVLALAALALASASFTLLPSSVVDKITDASIRPHWRFITRESLEGRFTGSRGERMAADYIAAWLEWAGIEPAGEDGTYYQNVPIDFITPLAATPMVFKSGDKQTTLAYKADFATSTAGRATSAVFDGSEAVVFAGFGVVDSTKGWNDYKNVDVKGKVVLVLTGYPTLYNGTASLSMYQSKITTASKLGAKALIQLVLPGGYPFSTLAASVRSYKQDFSTQPATPVPLYAFVNTTKADEVAKVFGAAGLAAWYVAANSADFVPQVLTGSMTCSAAFNIATFNGTNVIGVVRGISKSEGNQAVVMSAHIDHIGVNNSYCPYGNRVCPGATDNGLGAALSLSCAVALGTSLQRGEISRPFRSVVFLFETGEELGLMGAAHYVRNPTLGLKPVADVNYDIPSVWGKAFDMVVVGRNMSNFGTEVANWVGRYEKVKMSDDPYTSMHLLQRQDAYVFLAAKIPGVTLSGGLLYPGHADNATYAPALFNQYLTSRYHQPTDTYSETMDLAGAVQNGRVGLRMVWAAAKSYKFTPTVY